MPEYLQSFFSQSLTVEEVATLPQGALLLKAQLGSIGEKEALQMLEHLRAVVHRRQKDLESLRKKESMRQSIPNHKTRVVRSVQAPIQKKGIDLSKEPRRANTHKDAFPNQ